MKWCEERRKEMDCKLEHTANDWWGRSIETREQRYVASRQFVPVLLPLPSKSKSPWRFRNFRKRDPIINNKKIFSLKRQNVGDIVSCQQKKWPKKVPAIHVCCLYLSLSHDKKCYGPNFLLTIFLAVSFHFVGGPLPLPFSITSWEDTVRTNQDTPFN